MFLVSPFQKCGSHQDSRVWNPSFQPHLQKKDCFNQMKNTSLSLTRFMEHLGTDTSILVQILPENWKKKTFHLQEYLFGGACDQF